MLALTVYRFSPAKIMIWAIDLRATASTPTTLTVKQASSAEIGNWGRGAAHTPFTGLRKGKVCCSFISVFIRGSHL
jgi:hypothetical protein